MIRNCLLVALVATALPAGATLTIQVNYTGPSQYQSYFTGAATLWENLLTSHQNGQLQAVSAGSSYVGAPLNTQLSTIFINAALAPDDGPGGTLGFAGPTAIGQDALGFILTTDGEMSFDSDDVGALVSNGLFGNVVLHEMAHVLGFGTLWDFNGVYVNGSGEYTGYNGALAWDLEFGQTGNPPVELGGGPGTADAHWNEVDGGAGPTGITDGLGRDLRDELMTGWLNGNSFISVMTVASFIDIGFTTVLLAPIPEVSGFLAMGLVFTGVAMKRRRDS